MKCFEIVRTDGGWHSRFRAANGKIVWWTENFSRVRSAEDALKHFGEPDIRRGHLCWLRMNGETVPVFERDERSGV